MPLTDSFLLDPLAPPRVGVWIALRTDGARGSGTEADPYDGSLRANPVLTVTGITRSGPFGTVATATCASHGFATDDIVVIAGASQAPYNGTFRISGVPTSNTFTYLMLSDPGGNATGSPTCTLDPCRFDAVMRTLMFPFPAPPLTIRLGPGTFQTKGWAATFFACWTPRSDWRIVGSGIDVTVLQLIEASIANEHYFAIGNFAYTPATRLDEFEVSDLTVDCNLAGQPVPAGLTFAPVTCGAIQAGGRHIRIRRVRAINFGCQAAPECFVITSAFARADLTEAVDCVIEDCVVEQPSPNSIHQISCLSMSSGEIASTGVMAYHRACVIRNCVVDCEYKDRPVPISQITFSGTGATVTTRTPHGRAANDWIRVSGALVNGSASNPFNGSFQITAVTPPLQFQYTMAATPAAPPLGDMWVGRFPSFPIAISQISRTGAGPTTVTVTTPIPHFRVPGNNVVINGAAPSGYNGSFVVTAVPSPNQLQFVLASDPGNPNVASAYMGPLFQALSNGGGTAAVVEGNRVFNCFISGPYHDTWNTRDLIIRNNHFRAVQEGPYQNMGLTSRIIGIKYHNSASQIQRIGDGKTARFTTQYNHGYAVGQAVKISTAQVQGSDAPVGTYNGYYSVESVPALNQFTYRMINDPLFDADASPLPQFDTFWQVDSLVIENNVIELLTSDYAFFRPVAIQATKYVGDNDTGSQRVFKRVVIRGNVIRHVDNVSDPSQVPLGIRLFSSFDAVVEDNVIDLASPIPMQHYQCDRIRYFNNRTSAGKLIQGVQIAAAGQIGPVTVVATAGELSTDIEEAWVLAF